MGPLEKLLKGPAACGMICLFICMPIAYNRAVQPVAPKGSLVTPELTGLFFPHRSPTGSPSSLSLLQLLLPAPLPGDSAACGAEGDCEAMGDLACQHSAGSGACGLHGIWTALTYNNGVMNTE